MRVERHIFGSFRGYTTLARSAGVSAEDARALESLIYSFGQTYDPGFYESLDQSTPFFTTNLAQDRRALTCVVHGRRDDARRPTLLFLTAIVSRVDWDRVMLGDIAMLMKSSAIWGWAGESELGPVELENPVPNAIISRSQVPRLLQLISHLERTRGLGTVVSETAFSHKDIRGIEMLIPPAERGWFTSAYRALSPQMPMGLVCLAQQAAEQPTTFELDENGSLSPYALALKDAAIVSGVVPTALVMGYQGFGAHTEPEPEESPEASGGEPDGGGLPSLESLLGDDPKRPAAPRPPQSLPRLLRLFTGKRRGDRS